MFDTVAGAQVGHSGGATRLTLYWEKNYLEVRGDFFPGKVIRVHYLEAYCRPNSHTTHWRDHTVIGHDTELVTINENQTRIELRCTLTDGVKVKHVITAGEDEVDFRITAHNPGGEISQAHWAQPCIRLGAFTGTGADATDDRYAYMAKSFVFLEGKPATMPTRGWATEARYTPGQVWAAPGVKGADVNPRPLNPLTPSNGLIGCFSADDQLIFATAFEPYQELFQGVIRCLHSDFRIGGLKPGETKTVHGKFYIVPNDVERLLERYGKDFPGQVERHRAMADTRR
ncbi:MAG: hypothetical protein ACYTGQ_17715 [Planctomycetota bacterium]